MLSTTLNRATVLEDPLLNLMVRLHLLQLRMEHLHRRLLRSPNQHALQLPSLLRVRLPSQRRVLPRRLLSAKLQTSWTSSTRKASGRYALGMSRPRPGRGLDTRMTMSLRSSRVLLSVSVSGE